MSNKVIIGAEYRSSTTSPPPSFHFHANHEIIFVTEGEVEINITTKTFRAAKGDIVILSNFESHSNKVIQEPYNRYILTISSKAFDEQIDDIAFLSMLKNRPAEFEHCVHVYDIWVFKTIMKNMVAEFDTNREKEYADELLMHFFKELLIRIYRVRNTAVLLVDNETMRQRVFGIQRYIDKHYASDIKISSLCNSLYINPAHFSRMFKNHVGMSPKQYLTHIRLNSVKNDLVNSNRSITDIALDNGFIDINNFNRTFKTTVGITPSQYRENNKKKI